MILLIQINNLSFHYYEFVKPIEDILKKEEICFESVHYKKLSEDAILRADKIIICGTSLKDNSFIDDIKAFRWLKNLEKPILGICGGMHLIGLIYEGELCKGNEIGLKTIEFKKQFLGMTGEKEVYELHNYFIKTKNFEVFAESNICPQAVKHTEKPVFGVVFHPEVRNKDIVTHFCKKI